MYGLLFSVATLFIIFRFCTDRMVELKWKIILTAALVIFRFFFWGLFSVIISTSILIIMIIMLRWRGSKVR